MVNTANTCYVIFKPKNKFIPLHEPLTLDNSRTEQKTSVKYLGLRIENNITWNKQKDHSKNKLSGPDGSLRNIFQCLLRRIDSQFIIR